MAKKKKRRTHIVVETSGSTAQCIIYHFWKQRNNVMHNHLVLPPIVLFKLIDRKMRNTITTRRDRKQFLTLMAKSSIIVQKNEVLSPMYPKKMPNNDAFSCKINAVFFLLLLLFEDFTDAWQSVINFFLIFFNQVKKISTP